jgi:glycosyltransferase involved in cell wall biosynthesis
MYKMKLVVISICKDESATIGELLDNIPKKIIGINTIEKLVISDGSTDDTAKIARKHGATVIEGHSQKRLAFRFQQAVEIALSNGADIAVNIDGDLQFNPADIPSMVEPIVSGEYDFAAADRFTDPKTGKSRKPENMPSGKYMANKLGSAIVSHLSGQQFKDVTCGFRAYSRKALVSINLNSEYTYTQETFQLLASKKLDIATVPVPVKYYPGRKSRVVVNFWKFLVDSGFTIIRNFRDFKPLRFFSILSVFSGSLGLVALLFLLQHWLLTDKLTPYKSVGFIGLYLVTVALFLFIIGLLADMLTRVSRNQEKIIETLKEIKYR